MGAHSAESSDSSFRKLLGTGLAFWLLGCLGLIVGARWVGGEQSAIEAVGWAFDRWGIGFGVGLVALIVRGVVTGGALGRALRAYAVPVAILAVLAGICYLVYPERSFLSKMVGYTPLFWVFGVLGWLWLALRPAESAGESTIRALLPPLVGGIAVLAGVVVPVFRSNEFIYRNAFRLTLQKAVFSDGVLTANAVIEIRKPGDYQFKARRFTVIDFDPSKEPEPDHDVGQIEWARAGVPHAGATGTFPVSIRWDQAPPIAQPAESGPIEDCVIVEVRQAAAPVAVIWCLSAPLVAQ
jgi:hypothetical protein